MFSSITLQHQFRTEAGGSSDLPSLVLIVTCAVRSHRAHIYKHRERGNSALCGIPHPCLIKTPSFSPCLLCILRLMGMVLEFVPLCVCVCVCEIVCVSSRTCRNVVYICECVCVCVFSV
ncbi:hypothetical protein AMECASPLE_012854 [Ameca splendens]|uniref:Uncharacterized protein n=1 Tax=Ameca splendens TaxID=208324 RepID=A0ABV0YP27_9TELE